MFKIKISALLALLIASTPLMAQEAMSFDPKTSNISKEQAMQLAQRNFAMMDSDKNGILSIAEKQAMLETAHKILAAQGKKIPAMPKPQKESTRQEFMALQEAIFDRIDTDKDGLISPAERDAQQQKRQNRINATAK